MEAYRTGAAISVSQPEIVRETSVHARRTQNLLVGWAKWCPKVEDILPGCEIDRERKWSSSPGLIKASALQPARSSIEAQTHLIPQKTTWISDTVWRGFHKLTHCLDPV